MPISQSLTRTSHATHPLVQSITDTRSTTYNYTRVARSSLDRPSDHQTFLSPITENAIQNTVAFADPETSHQEFKTIENFYYSSVSAAPIANPRLYKIRFRGPRGLIVVKYSTIIMRSEARISSRHMYPL